MFFEGDTSGNRKQRCRWKQLGFIIRGSLTWHVLHNKTDMHDRTGHSVAKDIILSGATSNNSFISFFFCPSPTLFTISRCVIRLYNWSYESQRTEHERLYKIKRWGFYGLYSGLYCGHQKCSQRIRTTINERVHSMHLIAKKETQEGTLLLL